MGVMGIMTVDFRSVCYEEALPFSGIARNDEKV